MSKYGVISGPHFSVFGPDTGKYRPEKNPTLDTFHAVQVILRPIDDNVNKMFFKKTVFFGVFHNLAAGTLSPVTLRTLKFFLRYGLYT